MEEKKLYGIFRIEKVKLCDGGEIMGRLKHAFREFNNDSFDPELTKYNNTFFFQTAKEVMKAYKDRVRSITTDKYKPPKNAVGIYECMFTSTAGAISKEREQEFFERTYKQLCQTFGKENVLAGAVHRDETTVHTHWFITPIFNTTSVLRRTKEEKENGTCRTITQPQLNATHWTGSPALMSELQDTMWEGVFNHFGLERGEVELTSDRTKKKKNVRSDIRRRDKILTVRERELETEKEQQKIIKSDNKKKTEYLELKENDLNRDKELFNICKSKVNTYIQISKDVTKNCMSIDNEFQIFQNDRYTPFPSRINKFVNNIKKIMATVTTELNFYKAAFERFWHKRSSDFRKLADVMDRNKCVDFKSYNHKFHNGLLDYQLTKKQQIQQHHQERKQQIDDDFDLDM